MYVERVKYQCFKNDEWRVGYYIAKSYNSDESIILNTDYKEVKEIWDFERDIENILRFAVDEKEDFEEVNQPKFARFIAK
ncbi:hypothetical protein [uncultured Clostridium sp.]|uniref:hypothetical protein n=1 Tax=uncultured Clostridium sp. TaxID=59620 RepID=UPI0025ED513C|nr:hypothetical protein [uncultured Clostridium sp.]